MFRYLRLKQKREKIVVDSGRLTAEWLSQDECFPATLKQINDLPEGAKRRIYRALLPPTLLFQFDIDPINWKKHGDFELLLKAEKQCGEVNCSIRSKNDSAEEVFYLQLMDNTFNGIDLNFILVSDPCSPFFGVDRDKDGRLTMFGKANRNLEEEQRAMQAGLAPGQARRGLSIFKTICQQIEAFIATCGHRAFCLEPLTYATACLFERHGFAYVKGHKLMDDIQKMFQPEKELFKALDGSTPFRRPEQWSTVRGRAWAIHDGILDVIDEKWDNLRMIKRVGRHAGVETFPDSVY